MSTGRATYHAWAWREPAKHPALDACSPRRYIRRPGMLLARARRPSRRRLGLRGHVERSARDSCCSCAVRSGGAALRATSDLAVRQLAIRAPAAHEQGGAETLGGCRTTVASTSSARHAFTWPARSIVRAARSLRSAMSSAGPSARPWRAASWRRPSPGARGSGRRHGGEGARFGACDTSCRVGPAGSVPGPAPALDSPHTLSDGHHRA